MPHRANHVPQHSDTHATGGSDAIAPEAIGAPSHAELLFVRELASALDTTQITDKATRDALDVLKGAVLGEQKVPEFSVLQTEGI